MRLPRNVSTRVAQTIGTMPVVAGHVFGYLSDQHISQLATWLFETDPILNDLLDESDLLFILVQHCRLHVNNAPEDFEGTIGQIPGISVDEIASKVVAFLESLPRRYFVFFEIPTFQKHGVPVIQMSNSISIVETIEGFDDRYLRPIQESPDNTDLLHRYKTYIRIEIEGYGNRSLVSASVAAAIGKLKHFVYLGTTFKTLREKELSDLFTEIFVDEAPTLTKRRVHAIICNAESPQEEVYELRLPFEISDRLNWVQALENDLRVFGERSSAASVLSGSPAVTSEEKINAIKLNFDRAASILDIPTKVDDADVLKTAIEWFFDSSVDKNNTFSFLQACIGLEALLGDEKKDRVTDKLADRYSYLLGKTASDRKKLRAQFIEIYDHRSNIMHGRRAKLKGSDFKAMSNAQKMLDKCIRIEISGLLKSLRDDA